MKVGYHGWGYQQVADNLYDFASRCVRSHDAAFGSLQVWVNYILFHYQLVDGHFKIQNIAVRQVR